MKDRTRVGIIFGGRSVEHEVSLASARSVMEAIDPERFDVIPIGITKEGGWISSGKPLALLEESAAGSPRPAAPADDSALSPVQAGLPGTVESMSSFAPPDVIFPLVHGIYGEDGTLQGLLEMADLPYVGSGVLGSSVGMDKDVSKKLFEREGLPVVECRIVRRADWNRQGPALFDEIVDALGLPLFVKPAGSGSSVGVSKVRTREEFDAAVRLAFEYDRKVMIERAVNAREIEVAVLGNDDPSASVAGEIVPCHEFYDYEAKYLSESQLVIPAAIPEELSDRIRALAIRAFQTLELSGLARVDFFLDRDSQEVFLNEVNTLPGFTPVSMYPRLWQATGLSYRSLITRLIELAVERHRARKALKTTYSPIAHP